MVKAGLSILFVATLVVSCRSRESDTRAQPMAEFAPKGVPTDWGRLGPNPGVPQSAEAVLGNEAALRLNQAADLSRLLDGLGEFTPVDAIVSVPVHFLTHDADEHNHPFGDGQKNASLGWHDWNVESEKMVPMIATYVFLEGPGSSKAALAIIEVAARTVSEGGASSLEVIGEISDDLGKSASFPLTEDRENRLHRAILPILGLDNLSLKAAQGYPASVSKPVAWLAPAGNRFAWPRIKARFWDASGDPKSVFWPLLFRFPYQTLSEGLSSLPENQREVFGQPLTLAPFAGSVPGGQTPDEALATWFETVGKPSGKVGAFLGGPGVHHEFKDQQGQIRTTASGGVDTYIVKERVGKNEVLYTCFDARDRDAEVKGAWGVPSGAGWHSIGHEVGGQSNVSNWTFAETIVNGFETTGIFAGWGVRTPYPYAEEAPNSAKDVVTFRVLRGGELFTTAKGHFHWYAVDASRKVCTTIWKHLGCPLLSDKELRCQN